MECSKNTNPNALEYQYSLLTQDLPSDRRGPYIKAPLIVRPASHRLEYLLAGQLQYQFILLMPITRSVCAQDPQHYQGGPSKLSYHLSIPPSSSLSKSTNQFSRYIYNVLDLTSLLKIFIVWVTWDIYKAPIKCETSCYTHRLLYFPPSST